MPDEVTPPEKHFPILFFNETLFQEGRTAILKALANDVALDSDVNVDQIASKTAFFSGADLKALLYNAQLESIRQSKDYALSVDRAPPTPRYQKGVKLGTFERKTPKKVLQKLEERDESFVVSKCLITHLT